MKEQKEKKVVGGKYTVYLQEELGSGTFAQTFACKDKTNPKVPLACKMIVKKHIEELLVNVGHVMKRIQDEQKSWKMLDHPNVVKLVGCEETKNTIYFFMERCNGGTLKEVIQRNKIVINYPQMVRLSKELISACAYLQEKTVLHRDIKPENIMISDNQVKLGDFGLAKILSEFERSTFFTFAGTLQFMAPEVLDQEKNPFKSDVWSVGVTMYLMFTNELPFSLEFKDNSDFRIKEKIKSKECKFDLKVFEEYPNIKEILSLMLKKNPDERPTMREIKEIFKAE